MKGEIFFGQSTSESPIPAFGSKSAADGKSYISMNDLNARLTNTMFELGFRDRHGQRFNDEGVVCNELTWRNGKYHDSAGKSICGKHIFITGRATFDQSHSNRPEVHPISAIVVDDGPWATTRTCDDAAEPGLVQDPRPRRPKTASTRRTPTARGRRRRSIGGSASTLRLTDQTRSGLLLGVVVLKNISEAKAELSALIDAVSKGEEVVIGKAGVPVAKLVRYTGATARRTPGALKGKIRIHEDFDELPLDIAAAFGMEPLGSCSTHASSRS